ncbi:MAG TPA: hypothetical protein VFZ16_16390 [Hyphomicrobiaceae bacterium]|nr:hypothetical protein [Hyphomicrobiaceae bacterium]
MGQTKLFTSNQSQAVRVIVPVGQSWAAWFENGPFLSGFPEDRDQGEQQEREDL